MDKEILLWMTDIKDEYLVDIDAEIMPGKKRNNIFSGVCFGLGIGVLAAAAILLIAVIRVENSNRPLQMPATLEREENMSTSAVVTEIETTEEVHIEDLIPGLEDDEMLIIRTGEENFVAVDRLGRVTQEFKHAKPYSEEGDGKHVNVPMVQIVKAYMPLPIAVRMDDGKGEFDENYLIGLFSLIQNQWVEEPCFETWNVLSPTICTDSGAEKGEGVLRNPDGSVFDYEAGVYERLGNYIYKIGGEYTPGILFDLNGNWVSEVNGEIIGVLDEMVIIEEYGGYVISGYLGVGHVKEMSGMIPVSTCSQYVNWKDTNGTGVVTDINLNRIVDDRILNERNPQMNETFYGISVVAVNQEAGLYVLKTTETMSGIQTYYLCDSEFSILEIYREEMQIVVNQVTEPLLSSQIPHYEGEAWILYKEEDSFWMRSVWEDNGMVYELPEHVYYSSFNAISRIGDVICMEYAGMGTSWQAYCITDGGNWQIGDPNRQMLGMEDAAKGGLEIRTPDETGGVLEISSKNPDTESWERHYFLEDGTYLNQDEQGELLYAAAEFYCVKDGDKIYVEDYSGNQYAELECEE